VGPAHSHFRESNLILAIGQQLNLVSSETPIWMENESTLLYIQCIFLLGFITKFPSVCPNDSNPALWNRAGVGELIRGTNTNINWQHMCEKDSPSWGDTTLWLKFTGMETSPETARKFCRSPTGCRTCSALTVPDNPNHCFLKAGWQCQLWWWKHMAHGCWYVHQICFV
jgi:hypothetical protein